MLNNPRFHHSLSGPWSVVSCYFCDLGLQQGSCKHALGEYVETDYRAKVGGGPLGYEEPKAVALGG